MITAAQRISPSRARLWLPFDGQWRQDVGANLVVDGDMEAATVTPPWSPSAACTPTKSLVDPHSGSRCLVLTTTSYGYVTQVLFVGGRTYHGVGYGAGDGVSGKARVLIGGTNPWEGTTSTVWQRWELVTTVAADLALYLQNWQAVPGYSRHDDVDIRERPLTTRNVGGMPGAPTYVRLGDGHTASTVPNQRTSSRGISLDGGDYVRVPMDFEYNEAFSISVLTDSIMPAASWLAATYDSATARGIRFGTTGSGALVAGMFDDGGRSITLTSANNVIPTPKQPRLYTLSYDGSLSSAGLTMWIDDQPVTAAGGGTALASSVSSGRDLLLGARWNAAAPAEILAASNIFCTSEYDTVLDSYELRMLKARMMKEMRV